MAEPELYWLTHPFLILTQLLGLSQRSLATQLSIRLKRFLVGRLPQTAITITEVDDPGAGTSPATDETTSHSSHIGSEGVTSTEVSTLSNNNHEGRRLMVWWPKDQVFYNGVIKCFHPDSGLHEVLYDDGDKELLNLKSERVRWLG